MSRFWAAGGSSSDSGSESDSSDSADSDSDDDNNNNNNTNNNNTTTNTTNNNADSKWKELSDESSDDDAVRVVKSAKDRFLLGFEASIRAIRTAMKAKDYNTISTLFDELSKAMIKAKAILSAGIPKPLVRILVDLEDYITERLSDKTAFKTLSSSQGRSLNRLKLTLKKHNKPYAVVIQAYRKNPTVDDPDDKSDSEDEDDEPEKNSDSDDDDDDDSDDDDDDDDDSEEDSDKKKTKNDSSSSSSVRSNALRKPRFLSHARMHAL